MMDSGTREGGGVRVENVKKAYRIEKLYADAKINDDEKRGLTEVRIGIVLKPSDWYKFQSQPFFQEMFRYLDNLEIQ